MHAELIDGIHLTMKQIFHAFKKQSRSVSQDLKMTKVDVNILLVLQGRKMMTKRALASELSFESNSLTRSLDRLIAQDIVVRGRGPSRSSTGSVIINATRRAIGFIVYRSNEALLASGIAWLR